MKHKSSYGQTCALNERLASLAHELCAPSAVTHDLPTLSNTMLDLALRHTSARRGSLMLLDESNRLSILASRGLGHQFHDGPHLRLGEGVAGIVAQRMSPVLVKDISTEMLFRGCRRGCYKTNSFISCPVASRQRLLGVLNVSDSESGEPFGEDDLELLKIISDQAALLIENRLLAEQVQAKAEEADLLKERLALLDAGRTQFLTRVSHELRTPLNAMKGAIHYLQLSGSVPPKKQRLFLSIISQETAKLIENVECLLRSLGSGDDGGPDSAGTSGPGYRELEGLASSALERALEFTAALLGVESCSVTLGDDAGNLALTGAGPATAESVPAWPACSGEPLPTGSAERGGAFNKASLPGYNNATLIAVPLRTGSRTLGVMNVKARKDAKPLEEGECALAAMLAERVANLVARIFSGSCDISLLKKLVVSLDRLLQASRPCGRKETLLRELLPPLLERLCLRDEDRSAAHYAAALYDLGLTDILKSLRGRTDLTRSEHHLLRLHPYATLSLLERFEFSDSIKSVILHHHEHWDGTGYPHGLRGAEIPFLSRIIAAADSFCAMVTEKPHKATLSPARALEEMRSGSGTRYDPDVVEALCEIVPRWMEGRGHALTPAVPA